MKTLTVILLSFSLVINAYSQSKTDSIAIAYFNNLIQYDSLAATQDIRESKIHILELRGLGHMGESFNTNEELELVEKRFGFKFKFDFIKAPYHFVQEKQQEYNNQIYQYLDSVLRIDSKNEILMDFGDYFHKLLSIEFS